MHYHVHIIAESGIFEITPPDLDLTSTEFKSEEYNTVMTNILENQDALPDIMISEGYVYRLCKPRSGDPSTEDRSWKLWVPAALTYNLIKAAHVPPHCSHGGIGKTLYRLQEKYFWPGMGIQVKAFIDDCQICKETKDPTYVRRPKMGTPKLMNKNFQKLYIDYLGGFPRSKQGNTHVLVVLDQLSKFVFLKALKKATADVTIKFLKEDIFEIFGVPEIIYSDTGKQFISKEFQKFLMEYGVKHEKTPLYTPQSNAAERVNKSIVAGIRAYLQSGDQRNWDLHISSIASSLRSSKHNAICTSPHLVVFGTPYIGHGSTYDILRKLDCLNDPLEVIPAEDKLQIIKKNTLENISKAQITNKNTYDLKSRNISYREGQEVYRKNFILSTFSKNINAKLCNKWIRCRIKKKLSNAMYEIEDLTGKYIGIYHSQQLKQ